MQSRVAHIAILVFTASIVAGASTARGGEFEFPSPAGHFEGPPAFSPDGKMIAAFVSGSLADGGAGNGLTLINTTLWERMGVGNAPPQISWRSTLSFSPDGRHLLVNAAAGSDFADLWVMEVATRKWARVTGTDRAPGRWGLGKWSPDGKLMIAGGDGKPWTIWEDAGGVTPVPFADWPADAIADVAWSADGQSLWVGVNATTAPESNAPDSATTAPGLSVAGLYRHSLSDHSSTLAAELDSIRSVHPSPSGGVIACVTGGSLVLVDPADQSVHAFGAAAGSLTWSPNGQRLAVQSPRGPQLIDVAERRRVRLPGGAESIFFSPAGRVWGARGDELISLSDGRWAPRFRLGATRAMQLAVRDLDGDGRIDGSDVLIFVQCAAGPNRSPSANCPPGVNADFDQDGDVDIADYAIFHRDVHPEDFRRNGGVIISH